MNVSPTINSFHGRIRAIIPPDPGPGNQLIVTVPPRRRWKILTFTFALTTLTSIADRIIPMHIHDGIKSHFIYQTATTQPANSTRYYHFSNYGAPEVMNGNHLFLPLPTLILPATFQIHINVINLQTNDFLHIPALLIEEWIDP